MAEIKDFDRLYTTYWHKVYRLCMGYVNDDALARDLAQETFILVWENLPQFREEAHVGTWIFRIASNRCLRQLEKNKKRQKAELPLQLPEEAVPDRAAEVELLYRFIAELPETDRIIISLELEEVKQGEIAHILGLSEGNVRVRIHRIKERLTQRFKEHGFQ
ncbi:RNA polymerase sigma factor [Leadbetterella sp. DM7]|uniref:RNA polymerase sigma factor n=1 Tax=Leadbetterella sp. DM7 TaxID=3235085 RepID=UPI00349E4947